MKRWKETRGAGFDGGGARLQNFSVESSFRQPETSVQPSKGIHVIDPGGSVERTYVNVSRLVTPTGCPFRQPPTTQVPAIPRSQMVKRIVEPSYSTLLQPLPSPPPPPTHPPPPLPPQPHLPSLTQRHPGYSLTRGGTTFAHTHNEGVLSGISEGSFHGSADDEFLRNTVLSTTTTTTRTACLLEGRNSSPPSPVSSSYSELRQATGGGEITPAALAVSASLQPEESFYAASSTGNVRGMAPPMSAASSVFSVSTRTSQGEGDDFGPCSKCRRKIIGEGSGCTAMGRLYHILCFTCSHCRCQLQGKPFYALDGKPFCETDYMQTLEKCCKCSQPILDRILRATGKPYHPKCFTCVVCGKSLDGVPFTVDATNQIHCIEDFHLRFAPRCSVCHQPIMPESGNEETVRVVALDRSFHVCCYKCEDCDLVLSSESEGRGCYPLDDHVLCKHCNTKRIQLLTQGIE